MNEQDAQASLLAALQKRYGDSSGNGYNVGGYGVDQFDVTKVQFKVVRMEYPNLENLLLRQPLILNDTTIDNPMPTTVTHTFEYDKETTDSYEWHITGGLKIGIEQKLKIGLPIIGEGEATATAEISLEAGSVSTHSETVSWHDTVEIEIPPNISVRAQALLSTGTVTNASFKAYVLAYGQVGAHIHIGTNQYTWEWADLDTGGWYDPGFTKLKKLPLDDADRQFTVDGTFSGAIGFSSSISTSPIQVPEELAKSS